MNSVITEINGTKVELITLTDKKQAKQIRIERGLTARNYSVTRFGSDVEDWSDFEWQWPESYQALNEAGLVNDNVQAVVEIRL